MRGFTLIETIIGAALGLSVLLASLAVMRGTMHLSLDLQNTANDDASAQWVLDRIAADVARAGIGINPSADPHSPDERVELLQYAVVTIRTDSDRDHPLESMRPERWLRGRYPRVAIANDEIVSYLRRNRFGRGRGRATLQADVHSSDWVDLPDGTPVARRDAEVETVDLGPFATQGESTGTLYRVRLRNDARRFPGGRFRVMSPLADSVDDFRVVGIDASGMPLPECGGAQSIAAISCRGAIERLQFAVTIRGVRFEREMPLPRGGSGTWSSWKR